MSRKDYVGVAAVLAGGFASGNKDARTAIWRVTLSLADTFAKDNPRFDRGRFYEAVFGTADHLAVLA